VAASLPDVLPIAQRALWIKDVFLRQAHLHIEDDYKPFEGVHEDIDVQTIINTVFHSVAMREATEEERDSGHSTRTLVEYKVVTGARFTSDVDGEQELYGEVVAVFSAVYLLNEEVENDALIEFGLRNAPYHVWPYWREFLHAATGRLRLPPAVLPVYLGRKNGVPEVHEEPEAEVADEAHDSFLSDREIDADDRYEIIFWTTSFNVDESILRRAMANVGCNALDVRKELHRLMTDMD